MVHHKALRDNFDSMQMSRDWVQTLYAFSTDSVPLMIWPVFEGTLQIGRESMAPLLRTAATQAQEVASLSSSSDCARINTALSVASGWEGAVFAEADAAVGAKEW